jgi:predicted metalloprotease with PDZ domain
LRLAACSAVLSAAAFSPAEIQYVVHPNFEKEALVVTMTVPLNKAEKEIAFQMPRWEPGSYGYGDPGKAVADLTAKDEKGVALTVDHPDFSTWRVANPPIGEVTVTYSVKPDYSNEVLHYSGPETYLYVVGRTQEKCRLTVDVPDGWPIAIGLNPAPGEPGSKVTEIDKDGHTHTTTISTSKTFLAPTYDVLADNPVSAGKYYADGYMVAGRQHFIALRGAPDAVSKVDKDKLQRVTKFISAMETNFWGDAPYDRYVWHVLAFPRPDGGWGLEHLSSTQIGLATGFGPGTDGVLSHEFFHLWNVKRIRSKPLGPFNYQELPQTGALWWLEGVTDYYAHLLLRRYGWTDDARFYKVLAGNVSTTRSNEKRLTTSPYDSSFRVREANNGRGNSSGYDVNYYNTGWLAGLCLDMAIRTQTNNRKSLDDVARALYKKYGHAKEGFPEDGIRAELVRVAGPALGTYYDQIVMHPGELPVEDALGKVGLKLENKDEQYATLGFRTVPNREKMGIDVREPQASVPGLKEGDLIVGINGQLFAGMSMSDVFTLYGSTLNSPEIGKVIHVTVKREGTADPLQVDVTPVGATRKVWVVGELAGATPEAVALRKAWLTPPKNWTPPTGSK